MGGPVRRRQDPAPNAGTYLGSVTRLDGPRAYVEVPRLVPGYEYGPASYPSEYGPATDVPLAVGDRVAVGFLEGGRDNCIVLLRLA